MGFGHQTKYDGRDSGFLLKSSTKPTKRQNQKQTSIAFGFLFKYICWVWLFLFYGLRPPNKIWWSGFRFLFKIINKTNKHAKTKANIDCIWAPVQLCWVWLFFDGFRPPNKIWWSGFRFPLKASTKFNKKKEKRKQTSIAFGLLSNYVESDWLFDGFRPPNKLWLSEFRFPFNISNNI